jgi:16S rRNA (uracil1498-N3)-methyltransferase
MGRAFGEGRLGLPRGQVLMALRRFWIDASCASGRDMNIADDLFHHIRDVCRFSQGDRFELLPGDGKAYLAEIAKVNKRDLSVRVLESRDLGELKRPWIHLALSVPKYQKVDFIVEKCVELGVHEVSLFVSDCSFPRQLNDLSLNRQQRWEKIIKAATQQSGRGELMRLAPPATLADVLKDFKSRSGAVGLFPYEGDATLDWKEATRNQVQKRFSCSSAPRAVFRDEKLSCFNNLASSR